MPLLRKPSSLSPSSYHHRAPSSPSSPSSFCAPRTSMDSYADSGYASGSSSSQFSPHPDWLSPHPDFLLSRKYENWKIADAATQRLFVDLQSLEECKTLLRAAEKQRNLATRSSKPDRKPSLLHMPFKRRSVKSDEVPISSSPPTSFPADSLTEQLPSVEELEDRLKALDGRISATQPAAERLDMFFEELRNVLDDGRPESWQSSSSTSSSGGMSSVDAYTKARKTVGNRDKAYLDSKMTTKALQHACNAIQSAHHHYKKALELLDAVCSPKKGRWEAILGDEQSRQDTYREAAEWAQKAQMCFNECVKALQPHWDLLKRDEVQDCEDLQETGLLQAVQLYKLMYGGKVLQMGITQQVQIMVQKQEAVYQRLTSFAVWVQNCTKHCETVELKLHESRDAARRELVALWVKADDACERYSLLAPSETSHVFVQH